MGKKEVKVETVQITGQPRNINDLRTVLCEEIDRLRNEKTNAANVNAIVNATGKVLSTIKMEMEYSKLSGIAPKMDFIQGQLQA